MTVVYLNFIGDSIGDNHINILQRAADLGDLTIGLLSDDAARDIGLQIELDYSVRFKILSSIKLVSNIIPKKEIRTARVISELKPDIIFEPKGFDIEPEINNFNKNMLDEIGWKGELVEFLNEESVDEKCCQNNIYYRNVRRENRIRYLLDRKKTIKILEVHNPISALIVEDTKEKDLNSEEVSFEGMWSSSLTDSTSRGKPDIEAVDVSARINMINEIFEVTTKPMIFDADTGGKPEHFAFTVCSLERIGVSAAIVEDKIGLKRNSLLGNQVLQEQDSIESFCEKIKIGKAAQKTLNFMIIARVESLILEKEMSDAIDRALAYVQAGADGIMIHSRSKHVDEIREFAQIFRSLDQITPLVVVPTSFNNVTVSEFEEMGINIIIYANHLLRASYPNMHRVAKSILKHSCSLEAEKYCMSVNEILGHIPGTK